ncbi:unnamed protein product [Clonostachys rosea]|uniref:F-box domain-containing protein n=1 Tax=Bionectria ochroleuca TaxID=29856 RepID=A0ABY6ULC1_BIOOC|nr:unnamed protein product [Clonostachys rosea]
MDHLPQEIYDEIVSILAAEVTVELASYATISRRWQMAVEKQTCRFFILSSDQVDEFNSFFATRHRRRFIRTLYYKVRLPDYDWQQLRRRYETEHDRRANDQAFTAAIKHLFQSLSSWDPAVDLSLNLKLTELMSPSDNEPPEGIELDPVASSAISDSFWDSDLGDQRHLYSYIQLLESDKLPEVPVVESLLVTQFRRKIAHCVPLQITAKLPNLREATLLVDDTEDRYPLLRAENREAMTGWLPKAIPNATELRDLTIDLNRLEDSFAARLTNGMPDHLCSSIREATAHLPNLKALSVSGTIDKSLFWPGPSRSLAAPFWQNLQALEVDFYASMTSNGWYFKGLRTRPEVLDGTPEMIAASIAMPPGYADDGAQRPEDEEELDFDRFLEYAVPEPDDTLTPDDNLIEPLLQAFGKACVQMPNLRKAHLASSIIVKDRPHEVSNDCQADWGVWYIAPHQALSQTKRAVTTLCRGTSVYRRLIWDVGDWRPSEPLRSLFNRIGQLKHGGIMIERYVDTWDSILKPRLIEAARREAADYLGRNFLDDEYMEFMYEQHWDPENPYFMDILDEDMYLYDVDAVSDEWDLDEFMTDDPDAFWEDIMEAHNGLGALPPHE